MSMRTEGTVVTVKKIDKKYVCVDQNGVEHSDVPDWRWRRAYKGEFKLIKKFDKTGRAHWKRYYEDYDGPVQAVATPETPVQTEPVIAPLFTPSDIAVGSLNIQS